MSLLSSKFVCLALGPRAVRASLHSRWSRGKVLAQSRREVDPLHISPAPHGDTEPLAASIEGVQAVLSELTASSGPSGTPLRVQISDALVHFDVVAGDFAESSERQLQAIATACVDELLGDHAGPQVVRWQLQADDRHLLIAALQTATVDAIVQEAARNEMRLETLQPEFCARWNAQTRELSGALAVFASVADGSLVMALVEQGSITALSTGALGADRDMTRTDLASKTALDLRADRLATSQGVDVASLTTFVLVAGEGEQLAPSPRWTVVRLEEASA